MATSIQALIDQKAKLLSDVAEPPARLMTI
jgi:hypothetical protein